MSFIEENGYLILFICSVLYYCSPVIKLISVMQDKENRKSFPAFFLIFGALNSFYWIVFGLLSDDEKKKNVRNIEHDMHIMQGILGAMLFSLWLILYIINTSSSKCSSMIHIIIFFAFCITGLIIIFNWVSGKNIWLNLIYVILNILMFSTSLLPIVFGNGWVHSNIPVSIPFTGVFFSLSWFVYYILNLDNNILNVVNWTICLILNIIQMILYFTLLCKKNDDDKSKNNVTPTSMKESLKDNESKVEDK